MRKIISGLGFILLCHFSVAQKDSALLDLVDTSGNTSNLPLFSMSGDDAESGLNQQDVSSLLQSSRDVFTQFAGMQFGAARYRLRGYTAENQQVLINGINVNNLESGYSSWSNWGGLNDVTRYTENRFGIYANRYAFSGVGGYTNIDSKASSFKKGNRFSYALSNRSFRNRVMFTHSSGMQRNGWAYSFSFSARWGNEVYVPGTYFNAKALYLAIDRRINHKNTISFTAFTAPIEQGRTNAATKETYELASSHYYNSAWGYQNGKVRNANVSNTQRPMLLLSQRYQSDKNLLITSSLSYNFGRTSQSGIMFNDAPNPRPDYYRYLPSYYYALADTAAGDALKENWSSDITTRQINWDRLIAMNQANLYTDPHLLGQGINNSETRARYIVERRVENLQNLGFTTVINKRLNKWFLSAGLNANHYVNRKFKEVEDLLGASFWLDVDQFAEGLGVEESIQQNDLDNPNKKVKQGDKFAYDYAIHIKRAELWSQAEYNARKFDCFFACSFSDVKVWREGFVANGKFPNNSKGNSEKINFFNYAFKSGLTHKISGRQFFTLNASYLTRAPETNNLFISPRVRNDLVSYIKNEEVISGDLNYLVKYPELKLRFTFYNTQINHQLQVHTYWHDVYNTNVNLILKDLNQNHSGLEFGLEKIIQTSHVLQYALGINRSVYTNRPSLDAWQDNNNAPIYQDRVAYLKNYRVGGSPQVVTGIGYRYNNKNQWFVGLNLNYFDQIYVEANPDRRTEEAAGKFQSNETELSAKIVAQEKLPAYYLVNAVAGKSFRLKKKYPLNLNLSINNLLNNKNILVSGFEQLRWDASDINKFPTKYYYQQGFSFLIAANFNF